MAQNLTVYSWNMLYRNTRPDEALSFIRNAPFDIFCLQEVPEPLLKRLKDLPFHLAYRTDVERVLPGGSERNFVVILSKHPLTAQGEIPYPEYWPLLPLRTRLFVNLMPSRFFSKIRDRGGVFADVALPDGLRARVFNVHLILAHPTWRLEEFERAMASRDPSRPAIVCGDFNTLESPHITPLNWILGGELWDALDHRRERTRIEKRFVEHELVNPLRGAITHPISQSQLDHILVSRSFSVHRAEVLPDPLGSDHHPIRVEITRP